MSPTGWRTPRFSPPAGRSCRHGAGPPASITIVACHLPVRRHPARHALDGWPLGKPSPRVGGLQRPQKCLISCICSAKGSAFGSAFPVWGSLPAESGERTRRTTRCAIRKLQRNFTNISVRTFIQCGAPSCFASRRFAGSDSFLSLSSAENVDQTIRVTAHPSRSRPTR